eukprot:174890-Hanusia_phi.AAC.1
MTGQALSFSRSFGSRATSESSLTTAVGTALPRPRVYIPPGVLRVPGTVLRVVLRSARPLQA